MINLNIKNASIDRPISPFNRNKLCHLENYREFVARAVLTADFTLCFVYESKVKHNALAVM